MTNKQDDEPFWGNLWREALVALTLGWDLALPIFAGVFIGQVLDRWLGTVQVFTLGLLMLGIALGYYNLARFIQRVDRRDRQLALDQKEREKQEKRSEATERDR